MAYHLDFGALGLDWLEKRLHEEDLIPSQLVLREGLKKNLAALAKAGFQNLEDLDAALSTAKTCAALAVATKIGGDYLKILGRVLRGYRPKPVALSEYPGAPPRAVKGLAARGLKTSRDLHEAASDRKARKALARDSGIDEAILDELAALSGLSRIQWVSPMFSRLLHDAGYSSAKALSRADAKELCIAVDAVNRRSGLFKGKVGEKDMARLVFIAKRLEEI